MGTGSFSGMKSWKLKVGGDWAPTASPSCRGR